MAKKNPDPNKKISGDTGGGNKGGRQVQHGEPDVGGARGESIQGPRQDAKGGPAGANQGGAPRGAARMEPSHTKGQQRKERGQPPHKTGE